MCCLPVGSPEGKKTSNKKKRKRIAATAIDTIYIRSRYSQAERPDQRERERGGRSKAVSGVLRFVLAKKYGDITAAYARDD